MAMCSCGADPTPQELCSQQWNQAASLQVSAIKGGLITIASDSPARRLDERSATKRPSTHNGSNQDIAAKRGRKGKQASGPELIVPLRATEHYIVLYGDDADSLYERQLQAITHLVAWLATTPVREP
ncbi:hypothetical protein [Streptomyces tateyamensis]|uniref:hypothetical protein n=1 Tax=Streptomyces tateyamensis TaxID=565073 RepID=UPI0015E8AEBE|nr:hypothetical protein [Streptomyces tateyamensis]